MNLRFDLKYAWRLLKKSWGYSLMCASVVALGVGLAIWTWVMAYGQMFKPLQLPNSENWYSVQIVPEATGEPRPGTVDAYTYQELLKHNRSADHLGAYANQRVVLSEGQASTSLRGAAISPRLFAQVKPLLGRTFQEADGQSGAPAVAILSFDTWQTYFAGDPTIVGRATRIDSAPVQVIGVMAKDFYAFQDYELWLPLRLSQLARPRDSTVTLAPLIVLKKDRSLATVASEMKTAVDAVNRDHPELFNAARHVTLIPAHRSYTASATPFMAMVLVMAAAVLLLGGVNIGFVFLARLLERSRELALRTALGASRSRLLRQSLLETSAIVLLGLVAGWGVAALGIQWTQSVANVMTQILGIGRVNSLIVGLRPPDLAAAVAFAVAIWLLSTLIPAWRIAQQDAAVVLAGSGKGASNRGSNKSARLLVALEVLISCLVLVVCGSIVLAVDQEVSKPNGINSERVMIAAIPTAFDDRYSDPARRLRYWEDVTAAVASRIPGAEAAFTSAAPTKPTRVNAAIETQQGTQQKGTFTLPVAVVSDNYFDLLGVRLRSGRLFDSTDNSASLNVAVIDEGVAARYWPDQEVVGKRLQLDPGDNGPWLTIVGVVSAVGGARPYRKEDVGVVYRPLLQGIPSAFNLLVKLPNAATDSRFAIRAAAFGVDRDLPLNNVQTLEDYLSALKLDYEAVIAPMTVVALITALIAASGVFGLISRSVAQRTQEVGIRRALGATSLRATSIFLRQGALYLAMAIVGVGLGIMMMPVLSRTFTNIFNFAIPLTLGVVLLMASVIFTAAYLPSRRAVALEPGEALRYE